MTINKKQIEAVIDLPGEERYRHFVKVVVDYEKVWGLYQNGWALASTDDGNPVFPVWPKREYAELCAIDEWRGFEPRAFSLSEFLGDLIPKIISDGVSLGIFPTPESKGVTPEIEDFLNDLYHEEDKY